MNIGPYRVVGAAVGRSGDVPGAGGACCGRTATAVAACVIPALLPSVEVVKSIPSRCVASAVIFIPAVKLALACLED